MTVVQLSDKKSEPEIGSRAELENLSAPSLALQLRDGPSATLSWLISQTSLNFAPGLFDKWPRGDGHPVLVVPGFLAGRASTQVLRRFLRRQGYFVHDWHGGRNLGIRHGMIDRLAGRLREIHAQHQRRISIIGWSAGGIYARELARRHPELVRCVITLGSPIRGNPKAASIWWLYSMLNTRTPQQRAALEPEARRLTEQPLQVPTSCLFSRADGVVAWQRCTSLPGPRTENIEVQATHLGLGNSLETLFVIADRLAQEEGSWRAFSPSPDDRPNPD